MLRHIVKEALPQIHAAAEEETLSRRMWRTNLVKMKITKHRTGSCETWYPLISDPDTRDKWFNNLTLSEGRFELHHLGQNSPGQLHFSFEGAIRIVDQTVNVALDAVIGFALLSYKPCNEGFASLCGGPTATSFQNELAAERSRYDAKSITGPSLGSVANHGGRQRCYTVVPSPHH